MSADVLRLSRATARKINWEALIDRLPSTYAGDEGRPTVEGDEGALGAGDDAGQRLRELQARFSVVREEFERVLGETNQHFGFMIRLLMVAVIFAVGGIIVNLLADLIAGAVVSLTSLGVAAGLAVKVTSLARDQSMLKLVPARYELAISVCPSEQCVHEVIAKFIDETRSRGIISPEE